MSSVTLVSAFGRGETLALALREHGFEVRILDFSPGFPPEYEQGIGPFPVVLKTFLPSQVEWVREARPIPQGLSFWLHDGPLELTGPLSEVHARRHPEVAVWRGATSSRDFTRNWLERFLRQWTSPYFSESWSPVSDEPFPAAEPLGTLAQARELELRNFERAERQGLEVLSCTALTDVRVQSGRLEELEVESGRSLGAEAPQWVWCLSSPETRTVGDGVAEKMFSRGVRQVEWTWLSFSGQLQAGPWSQALPSYCVVMGDIYLPWTYSNAAVMRRLDETRCRFWLKVPRSRVQDIDARRGWAADLQRLLNRRLPLAQWTINSSEWSWHSEIFASFERGETPAYLKNCDLIVPETLPRLDLSARLEREAEAYHRLVKWRADQLKKQGVRHDQTLHAP